MCLVLAGGFMYALTMNLRIIARLRCLAFIIVACPTEILKAEESMSGYTTCAVYHRMMAGAMRRNGNLSSLADLEVDKMGLFVRRAKRLSVEMYGEELGEEIFNEEWAAIQLDMTDMINRNYDNISRLRVRYKESCDNDLSDQ